MKFSHPAQSEAGHGESGSYCGNQPMFIASAIGIVAGRNKAIAPYNAPPVLQS
jgi:hypothetical protein